MLDVAPDWSVALRLRRSCVMACRAFESLISIWTRSEADSDPLRTTTRKCPDKEQCLDVVGCLGSISSQPRHLMQQDVAAPR